MNYVLSYLILCVIEYTRFQSEVAKLAKDTERDS